MFRSHENIDIDFLDSFSIKGRCEVISEDPYILLDVCHNLPALEKLRKELLKKIEGKKTAAIFASSKNSYDLISPLKEIIEKKLLLQVMVKASFSSHMLQCEKQKIRSHEK